MATDAATRLAQDLAALIRKDVPIYCVREDLAERGLLEGKLLEGIVLMSRTQMPRLFGEYDQVWRWETAWRSGRRRKRVSHNANQTSIRAASEKFERSGRGSNDGQHPAAVARSETAGRDDHGHGVVRRAMDRHRPRRLHRRDLEPAARRHDDGHVPMIKDGKPIFYELLLIAEDTARWRSSSPPSSGPARLGGGVVPLRLPLVAKRDGRIYFDGMTFERVGADRVKVYLAIEHKDGSVREEIFEYSRTKP